MIGHPSREPDIARTPEPDVAPHEYRSRGGHASREPGPTYLGKDERGYDIYRHEFEDGTSVINLRPPPREGTPASVCFPDRRTTVGGGNPTEEKMADYERRLAMSETNKDKGIVTYVRKW